MGTVLEREHVSAKTKNTPQHINQAGDLYCLWQAFWIALCQAPGTYNGHYLAQVSSKAAVSACLVTQLTMTCLPLSILAGRLATNTPPALTPSHRSQQVTQKKQNQTPASAFPHLKNNELLEGTIYSQQCTKKEDDKNLQCSVKTQRCKFKTKAEGFSPSLSSLWKHLQGTQSVRGEEAEEG